MRVSHVFYTPEVGSAIVSKDGFIEIPGTSRKIDVLAFDAEAKRFQASVRPTVVLNSSDKPIDAIARIEKEYKELVEGAGAFEEVPDPEIMSQLGDAIRGKRSAVVLGKAGTGKSSAIYAFARLVREGKVPGVPRSLRIFEVLIRQSRPTSPRT